METVYYTPREVADRLRLRVQTVYDYIRKGRLPAVRLGNRCRIAHSDLEAFLAQRSNSIRPGMDAADEPSSPGQLQAAGPPMTGDPRKQTPKNEAARRLLAEGMADESGYDEKVWPTIERLLHEHPVSLREPLHE